MEDNNQKLRTHFLNHYSRAAAFPERIADCNLTCKHAGSCSFDSTTEASFSGAIGDYDSTVMLIAESPSVGWGKGAHFSGHSENFVDGSAKKVTELVHLISYIKELYGKYPYFTDWIKCGVKSTKDKALLNTRKKNCVETHVKEEILILNPTKIICLGADCYKDVFQLAKILYPDKKTDDLVVKLTHFSRRASLPLTIADKKDIIWRLELGLINDSEEAKVLALQLSHLVKKIPKN